MIYFSSDFHYNHKNIVAGISEWESKNGCRDFETLEEHNTTLVNNINAVVGEDDTLYFLGDWSFGGKDTVRRFREQIVCRDIILICGNHDHHIRNNQPWEDGVRPQDLFTSVHESLQVKINRKTINMYHYSCRVWDKSYKGSWMLYGHSHGSLPEYTQQTADEQWVGDDMYVRTFKTMDVGIDTHPEFRPYSMSELVDIMEQRNVLLDIDHHGITTR